MAEYLVKGETLTAIADAIRNKTGKTNTITLDDFVTEIEQVDYREVIETVPFVSGTLTYNGSAQSPTLLAYNPDQLMMTGISSATNAGTYEIAFSPKDGYKWADDTTTAKVVSWSIAKAAGSLSLSATSGTITGKNSTKTFTVTRSGDGKISASSSNTSIATVSLSGTTVTVASKGYGSAAITVSVAEGTNHTAPDSKTYELTVDYLYLYTPGDEKISVTGGWTSASKNIGSWGNGAGTPVMEKTSTHIKMHSDGNGVGSMYYTENKIDLKNFSTIKFEGYSETAWQASGYHHFRIWSDIGTYHESNAVVTYTICHNGQLDFSVDVSNLTGQYHIGFGAYTTCPIYMYKLWAQ